MRLAPRLHERANQSVPILFGVFLGPLLLALWGLLGGRWLRRAGICFSVGATAAMANIGASSVVPGANDNLSAVGALVGARPGAVASGRRRACASCSLSTGSEESFMEGMQAFGRRHFPGLDPGDARSSSASSAWARPTSASSRREGMLRMRHYTGVVTRRAGARRCATPASS